MAQQQTPGKPLKSANNKCRLHEMEAAPGVGGQEKFT